VLLALVAGNAAAQYSLPARQVLAIAPQLEAFAGSKANLESLANGLRGGTEVRLVSMTREGMREIVTFTASEKLPAPDSARVLENARYHLLERGIGAPSGWDIALVLMGSIEITPRGPVRRPGLLTPANPQRAIVVALRPFAGSPANYRSLVRGLTEGATVTLADPVDRRIRVHFTAQCVLPEEQARQLLLAAAERVAARGIGDPLIQEVAGAVADLLAEKCAIPP
jgi:hypothetical protein